MCSVCERCKLFLRACEMHQATPELETCSDQLLGVNLFLYAGRGSRCVRCVVGLPPGNACRPAPAARVSRCAGRSAGGACGPATSRYAPACGKLQQLPRQRSSRRGSSKVCFRGAIMKIGTGSMRNVSQMWPLRGSLCLVTRTRFRPFGVSLCPTNLKTAGANELISCLAHQHAHAHSIPLSRLALCLLLWAEASCVILFTSTRHACSSLLSPRQQVFSSLRKLAPRHRLGVVVEHIIGSSHHPLVLN